MEKRPNQDLNHSQKYLIHPVEKSVCNRTPGTEWKNVLATAVELKYPHVYLNLA